MPLTSDQVIQILKEAIDGSAPSLKSEEALAHRAQVDKQVAELKAQGAIIDIPHEWPDISEEE